jgi:hypothetical protein
LIVFGVTSINLNFFNCLATQQGYIPANSMPLRQRRSPAFQAYCLHEFFQFEQGDRYDKTLLRNRSGYRSR